MASSSKKKNSTNKSTIDIIRDPVTGRSFSRDTAIAGSTYRPYTPSSPSVPSAPSAPLSSGSGTQYGAAGRGEFLDNPKYAAEQEAIIKSGAPMSVGSDYKSYIEPSLTSRESADLAKRYGLQGMNMDDSFSGLSRSQAMAKALEEGKKRKAQNSALTSGAFNPQMMSGLKKSFDNFRFSLDTTNNDPWISRNEKKDKNKALTESFASEFAKNFKTPEEFNAAASDPSILKLLKQYEQAGGDVLSITSKITTPNSVNITGETMNPDGSYNVQYSDGMSDNRRYQTNPDGTQTSVPANQSIEEYLGALSTPSQKQAFESMIPEQKVAQDQIAFEQSIPEQYRKMYFGDEEQVGILQQKKTQAMEEIKLIERKAKIDEKNAKAQAEYAMDKFDREQDIQEAEIEENRLAAKNYMTGQLAKLGALNTTGAAPTALATLEEKYQRQALNLKTNYNFAKQEIKLSLIKEVDEIGLKRDEDILTIRGDVTKNEEDTWKEIFKLQNDADRKTFDTIERYTKDFRTQADKYTKEAKAAAEKYAKEFAKNAGTYEAKKIASILEGSKGSDGYVNSETYMKMFDDFIANGGTRSEFLKKYPPAQYTNPNDTSLPTFLRFGTSVRSDINKNEEDNFDLRAWAESE